MSHRIPYAKFTNAESAYKGMKEKITPQVIQGFGVDADLKYDDAKKIIRAEGKGFKITFEFKADALEFDLDLTFLLKPLKGKIAGKIEKELSHVV